MVYYDAFDDLDSEGALYDGTDSEDELCDASGNKSSSFEFGPHPVNLFRFCSSHEVNLLYVNNLQIAAAVLLSGNNFGKVKRLAESINLAFISKPSYFRMQKLYLLPAANEWWEWMRGEWMRGELMNEFRGQDIIVSGDGQCDSPGFSAKNLCYFRMEVSSKYILHVQIVDKRHVGLVSVNMEVEGLKKSLTKVEEDLNVVELVTDASSSVKKLLGKKT